MRGIQDPIVTEPAVESPTDPVVVETERIHYGRWDPLGIDAVPRYRPPARWDTQPKPPPPYRPSLAASAGRGVVVGMLCAVSCAAVPVVLLFSVPRSPDYSSSGPGDWLGLMILTSFFAAILGVPLGAIAGIAVGAVHYAVHTMLPAGHRHHATSGVLGFWLAYILTRPLGASFADWMAEPRAKGGLEWGQGTVGLVMFVIIAAFVAYLAGTRRDVQEMPERTPIEIRIGCIIRNGSLPGVGRVFVLSGSGGFERAAF